MDISDDGLVSITDVYLITNNYNNITVESGYNAQYDINNDSKLNILDLYRIGYQYNTR